jgi:thioesterase domain-containing protein
MAYEMARMLRAQGEEVLLLALLDTWHPRFRQNWTWRARLRYAVHYIPNRVSKYVGFAATGDLAGAIDNARYWAKNRAEVIRWRMARCVYRNLRRPVPNVLKSESDDVRTLVREFIPKQYPGRMLLIRTTDEVERTITDEAVGWSTCVIGGVEVRYVESDHGDMVIDEHAEKLATVLSPFLTRSKATSRPS